MLCTVSVMCTVSELLRNESLDPLTASVDCLELTGGAGNVGKSRSRSIGLDAGPFSGRT